MSQEELRDLLKERTQKEKQIYIANVTGIGELFFFLVDEMADITFSRSVNGIKLLFFKRGKVRKVDFVLLLTFAFPAGVNQFIA